MEKVKSEMLEEDFVPDRIAIGGRASSITRHGSQNQCGFGPQRKTVYQQGGKGGERIKQEYHLTEPVKISMLERSRLVRIVDGLITFCEEKYPTSQIVYFRRCTHGMWRDAVRKTPTSPT